MLPQKKAEDSIASLIMLMKGILKAYNSFLFYRVFQKRISKEGHSRRVTLPICYVLFLKKLLFTGWKKHQFFQIAFYNGIFPVLLLHQVWLSVCFWPFFACLEKIEATSGEK